MEEAQPLQEEVDRSTAETGSGMLENNGMVRYPIANNPMR